MECAHERKEYMYKSHKYCGKTVAPGRRFPARRCANRLCIQTAGTLPCSSPAVFTSRAGQRLSLFPNSPPLISLAVRPSLRHAPFRLPVETRA